MCCRVPIKYNMFPGYWSTNDSAGSENKTGIFLDRQSWCGVTAWQGRCHFAQRQQFSIKIFELRKFSNFKKILPFSMKNFNFPKDFSEFFSVQNFSEKLSPKILDNRDLCIFCHTGSEIGAHLRRSLQF